MDQLARYLLAFSVGVTLRGEGLAILSLNPSLRIEANRRLRRAETPAHAKAESVSIPSGFVR
jgi:hypothetical protein